MLEMDYRERVSLLIKLRDVVKENEKEIYKALEHDLGKPAYESYYTEIGLIYNEINYTLKFLKSWMQEKTLPTPFFHMPAVSTVVREPYGRVLIISPWNFPFQLSLIPLVNAWAAGNVVTIKPSEVSGHCEKVLYRMITENFHTSRVRVITGGPEITMDLLAKKFDFIFFNGSRRVGKIVYEKASELMTPVCLQMGGKTPAIVDENCNLEEAAKRIVHGKFVNCGQNALAPEYVLVPKKLKKKFVKLLDQYIEEFYGENPVESENYGSIINLQHFFRLLDLIEHQTIILGGEFDTMKVKISPTVVEEDSFCSEMMKDEIFGPILPILTYEGFDEAVEVIERFPTPPACYIFTKNRLHEEFIKNNYRCGSVCVNDIMLQGMTSHLPLGGVGSSGMGRYHGKAGYDTFSNIKSIVKKRNIANSSLRYPPYDKNKMPLLKRIMKSK